MNECLSVSDINKMLNDIIIKNFDKKINIIGEITNFKITGGRIYMNLIDETSSISIIKWNCTKSDLILENNNMVNVCGSIKCFLKQGTYNIIATKIELINKEKSANNYLINKEKYEKLGYFNNQKELPKFIKNIGILTALDGAAIHDIMFVLNKNQYKGNVYIKNSIVQGNMCPQSIVSGIDFFEINKKLNIDVLLITRGGGSIEDLMGFSDPLVIEKLYSCKFYTVSAVGHETDFMLSDFVCNLRCPTPSIAAETLSSCWLTLIQSLNISHIKTKLLNHINNQYDKLEIIKQTIYNKI